MQGQDPLDQADLHSTEGRPNLKLKRAKTPSVVLFTTRISLPVAFRPSRRDPKRSYAKRIVLKAMCIGIKRDSRLQRENYPRKWSTNFPEPACTIIQGERRRPISRNRFKTGTLPRIGVLDVDRPKSLIVTWHGPYRDS